MIESLHDICGIFTNFTEVCGMGNIFVVHILFGELTEIIKLMERWLRDKDADKSIICIRLQCRRPFDHQPSPCKLDRFYQVSSTYYQVDPKVHSTKIPRFRLTLAFFIMFLSCSVIRKWNLLATLLAPAFCFGGLLHHLEQIAWE